MKNFYFVFIKYNKNKIINKPNKKNYNKTIKYTNVFQQIKQQYIN